MREVSPQDSSELQPKIGAMNGSLDEYLFVMENLRGSNPGMGVLLFRSHGGIIFSPEHSHGMGAGKSLVFDAIRDVLTHPGWRFSNMLKAQLPFSYSAFVDPPEHWQLIYSESGKNPHFCPARGKCCQQSKVISLFPG